MLYAWHQVKHLQKSFTFDDFEIRSSLQSLFCINAEIDFKTRMHSSRMRTGRSLTVCCSLLPGGVCLLQGVFSLPRGGLLRGVSAPGGSALGGCLLWGGGVSALGVVSAQGGFSLPGDPLPCEQNHTHV